MSRLIGAAPGYVGFEEGGEISEAFFVVPDTNPNLGQLTEAVRRKPYGTHLSNHHATFEPFFFFFFFTQLWCCWMNLKRPTR
jgi:hypothetical protein